MKEVALTMARLFLTGIRASGRHGANPGEKDQPQEFVIDLDVDVTVSGDDIYATADYRRLVATARETIENTSFDLLESLAAAVAKSVKAIEGVARAAVVVHKPAAAASLQIQGVAAAATEDG